MSTSRLRHIAPLSAMSTKDGAGNNAVSSSATAATSNDYEG
ncbi:glutamyl endopeptidase [Trifolium pratense]|uniref:Glutamyl endopeptidase n=1 Tax=Trifolium pratense TaxID=57577 RepID=A0A2K3PRA4_TRIPR|nr:glutamyl endopeptidase [Trifolium pratense]